MPFNKGKKKKKGVIIHCVLLSSRNDQRRSLCEPLNNRTAAIGSFTFHFSAENTLLALPRPDAAALNSSQQPALSPALSQPGLSVAQRCSLKLMKHQHTSLPPPSGHYAQPMSRLRRVHQRIRGGGESSAHPQVHLHPCHRNRYKLRHTFTETSPRPREISFTHILKA